MGLVVTSWMNFGFTYGPKHSSVTWRFPLALQALWSTITFSFALFMVESPRWLILLGRVDEARSIIARLHGLPADDPEVEQDLRIIVETVAHEMEQPKITIKDLMRGDEQQSLRRILLGCGVGFMQQAAGTNVLANYLPVVLTRSVGLSDRLALVLSSCNAVSLFFFGLAAIFFIDSVGRRKLIYVLILCRVRRFVSVHPMAIPGGDQLPTHAKCGNIGVHHYELGVRVRCRADHAYWHRESWVALLSHFWVLQCCISSSGLFLLCRNSAPVVGTDRSTVRNQVQGG
jgi:hypothetical protein